MNKILNKTDEILKNLELEKSVMFDLKQEIQKDEKIKMLIEELERNPYIKPELYKNPKIKEYLKHQNEIDYIIL